MPLHHRVEFQQQLFFGFLVDLLGLVLGNDLLELEDFLIRVLLKFLEAAYRGERLGELVLGGLRHLLLQELLVGVL